MRKKLREIRDKEEGFTLVELLAVIVILGIIVAIAVPAIGNVISESKDSAKLAEMELVEDAARLYFTVDEVAKETEGAGSVTVSTLRTKGYLDVKDADALPGGVNRSAEGIFTYESSVSADDPVNN